MKRSKSKKGRFFGIIGILVLILLILSYLGYKWTFSSALDITQTVSIYIDDTKDFNAVVNLLEDSAKMKNSALFRKVAEAMKYPDNLKTGKYDVNPKMNCIEIVRMLRNGNQSPVKLTFNNIRLKSELAERLGSQMMFGSNRLLTELQKPAVCAEYGFDTATVVCMFIPNTYEIYWNTPVDKFLQRMKKEYDRFWTDERTSKAKELSLSQIEVSTLASIVEEETASAKEYPIVAGLYINRLRKGMPLQADPTVKYAVGDFALRRILYSHLEIDSPYNTYKHTGLPPSPIRIPSVAGIDAVLNYSRHNYLYMVAKEDFSGTHNFAVSLSEHNNNARKYQEALNRRGIR